MKIDIDENDARTVVYLIRQRQDTCRRIAGVTLDNGKRLPNAHEFDNLALELERMKMNIAEQI